MSSKNPSNHLRNPKFEKAPEKLVVVKKPNKAKYPKPKKGEGVKCLGCRDGKVMTARGVIKTCGACGGSGNIVA